MGKRHSGPLPEEADRLKSDIQLWREARVKVGPMPAALWKRAACLAEVHGASPVAKSIGVDYSALREQWAVLAKRPAGPTFLEIPAAMVLAGAQDEGQDAEAASQASTTQVELALADGSRLRMCGSSRDTAAIVAAFMRRL